MSGFRHPDPVQGETDEQWKARLTAEFEADYPPLPEGIATSLRTIHAEESIDLILLHEEQAQELEELAVGVLHLLAYWEHALSEDTREALESLLEAQDGARR